MYVPVNLIYKIIKYYCFEILELSSVQSFSKHDYVAMRTFYDIQLLLTSYDMQLLLHNQEIWSTLVIKKKYTHEKLPKFCSTGQNCYQIWDKWEKKINKIVITR